MTEITGLCTEYIMLLDDDILREGDEYKLNKHNDWHKVGKADFGITTGEFFGVATFRRPIKRKPVDRADTEPQEDTSMADFFFNHRNKPGRYS